ncbi:MAG: hypothetical protein GWN85_21830 [Gemmatimonadetes bacterium]|nr:hypothetical protein [Gemmatimonadota bacterium]
MVDDPELGGRAKGGTVDFLLAHNNPILQAEGTRRGPDGELIWGEALKRRLRRRFTEGRRVRFEVFCDGLSVADCAVRLDPRVTDRWGDPLARIQVAHRPGDLAVGRYMARRAAEVLERLGAEGIGWSVTGDPPTNLVAGGCRFGDEPAHAVLDRLVPLSGCLAHELDTLGRAVIGHRGGCRVRLLVARLLHGQGAELELAALHHVGVGRFERSQRQGGVRDGHQGQSDQGLAEGTPKTVWCIASSLHLSSTTAALAVASMIPGAVSCIRDLAGPAPARRTEVNAPSVPWAASARAGRQFLQRL